MRHPFVELLTGEAFRPDPCNCDIQLSKRLSCSGLLGSQGRMLGIYYSHNLLRICVLVPHKEDGIQMVPGIEFSADLTKTGTPDEVIARVVNEAKRKARTNVAVLVPTCEWLVTAGNTAYRGSAVERNQLLGHDPKQVIGVGAAENTSYAAIPHPKLNRSIYFSFPQDSLEKSIEKFRQCGLEIARSIPAPYALLRWVLEEHARLSVGKDILVGTDEFVLLVQESNDDWAEVGFTMLTGDEGDALLLKDLLDRRPDSAKPLLWACTNGLNPPEGLSCVFPPTKVRLDMAAACVESGANLAADVNPLAGPPRPHLGQRAMLFYRLGAVIAVAMFGLTGFAFYTDRSYRSKESVNHAQISALQEERAKADSSITRNKKEYARAKEIGNWVSLGLLARPLVVSALDTGDPKQSRITLDQMDIILTRGSPQMEMRLTAKGERRVVDKFLDNLLANLRDANFRLVNPEQTYLPDEKGVRFVGKFVHPSPIDAKWGGAK